MPEILRRLGDPPAQRGSMSGQTCPDVLQLDTGDYLVIGVEPPCAPAITSAELAEHGASIGLGESAVVLPAAVFAAAARDFVAREKRAAAVNAEAS